MTTNEMPLIIKSINIRQAKSLKNLTIDFKKEGLTALLGPNGCGKSTILHLLACSYQPEDGQPDYRFPRFFHPVCYPQSTQAFSWEGTEYNLTLESPNSGQERTQIIRKRRDRWGRNVYDNRATRWLSYIGISSCVPDIENEKSISRINFQAIEPIESADCIRESASTILDKNYEHYDSCIRFDRKRNLRVSIQGQTYTSLSMGSGEQRVFRILEAVESAPPYGLILIDEIDLLLHEQSLKQLLKPLNEKAESKHLQIIFTAHNQSILSCTFIDFKHIFQTPEQTLCLLGNDPRGIERLVGDYPRDLEIFVEDELGKAIIKQICIQEDCARRTSISTFGAAINCFILGAGVVLQGQHERLQSMLLVLDGDVYCTNNDREIQIKRYLTGRESHRSEQRQKIKEAIKQLIIPEGRKPEEYYADLVRNLNTTNISNNAQALLNEIKEESSIVQNDHHQLLLGPINALRFGKEQGYSLVAELLSKTSEWNTIVSEVREWLTERLSAQ